ncbi:MAG: hypothetical protein JWO36_4261 [Myxococcales bacterium]|nr:hypothetical protein [Myxococcales bacterium]
MNFFGHAAVASWRGSDPGVALGAMLPDFASMCGGRLAVASDPAVEIGVELHHETDGVFHRLAPVTALMRELGDRLERGGCARGPKRAVAHIGVELLLDGVLVAEPAYRDAYLGGLGHDASGVAWREPGDGDRFAILIARLRAHGVPDDLRHPEAIAQRLHRMLSHRPLLAPDARDMQVIRSALVEYQARVEVAADTVMRAVRAGL